MMNWKPSKKDTDKRLRQLDRKAMGNTRTNVRQLEQAPSKASHYWGGLQIVTSRAKGKAMVKTVFDKGARKK